MNRILISFAFFVGFVSTGRSAQQQIAPAQIAGIDAYIAAHSSGVQDITSNWTSATTTVTVVGESIANGLGTFPTNYPAFTSGKCSYLNHGVNGSTIGDVITRYASEAYPYRPAANGGAAGITEAWLILVCAINNLDHSQLATLIAGIDSYVTQAHVDGFKVCVATTYYQAGCYHVNTSNLLNLSDAADCVTANLYIARSTLYDLVWSLHALVRGPTDPLMNADRVHLTTGSGNGYDKASLSLSNLYQAGYAANLMARFTWTFKGNGDNDILTRVGEQIAPLTYYGAAQGQQSTVLTPGSTVTWDTTLNQVARLTMAGNETINATGFVDGTNYTLKFKTNGNAPTFGPMFRFSGGTPTFSSSSVSWNVIDFKGDGALMQMPASGFTVMDPTPTATSGAFFEENFVSFSQVIALNGTKADTVNVSTNTWTGTPITRSANGNYAVQAFGATGVTYIDIGQHDGMEISWAQLLNPSVANATSQYILFRFDAAASPIGTACVGALIDISLGPKVYFIDCPNGYAGSGVTPTLIGTMGSQGDTIKIRVSGSTITFFKNGSAFGSPITNSRNNSAGKNGIGVSLDGGGEIQDLKAVTYP